MWKASTLPQVAPGVCVEREYLRTVAVGGWRQDSVENALLFLANIFDSYAGIIADLKSKYVLDITITFDFDAYSSTDAKFYFAELGPSVQCQPQMAVSPSARRTRAHEQLSPAVPTKGQSALACNPSQAQMAPWPVLLSRRRTTRK